MLCSFLFQFWSGMGLWYGMACLAVSSCAILPATQSIQTHHVDLQERLLELVMKRQELNEELAGLYERYEREELKRGPRRPIEVREEAAWAQSSSSMMTCPRPSRLTMRATRSASEPNRIRLTKGRSARVIRIVS